MKINIRVFRKPIVHLRKQPEAVRTTGCARLGDCLVRMAAVPTHATTFACARRLWSRLETRPIDYVSDIERLNPDP